MKEKIPTLKQIRNLHNQIAKGQINYWNLRQFLENPEQNHPPGRFFPIFPVTVRYGLGLAKLIQASKLHIFNPELFTSTNFLVEDTGTREEKFELYSFDEEITLIEAEAKIYSDGFKVAGIAGLCAFAAKYPKAVAGILALKSRWLDPQGRVGVPCYDSDGEVGNYLELCFDHQFSRYKRFLVSRRA